MRMIAAAIAMIALSAMEQPLAAKDITLALNEDEQRALVQLIDAANKAGGLSNAEVALFFVRKLQAAAAAPPPAPPAPVTAPAPEK